MPYLIAGGAGLLIGAGGSYIVGDTAQKLTSAALVLGALYLYTRSK